MKALVITALVTLAFTVPAAAHDGWGGGWHGGGGWHDGGGWGRPHGGWHDGWGGIIPIPRPEYVEPEYADPAPVCETFWRHHRRVTVCPTE